MCTSFSNFCLSKKCVCFICVVKYWYKLFVIFLLSFFYICGSVVILFFHTWLVMCVFFVFLVDPAKKFWTSLILSKNHCLMVCVISDETPVMIFLFLLCYIKRVPFPPWFLKIFFNLFLNILRYFFLYY